MSRLNHGRVDLELDGETVTLEPTLAALQAIDRHFGSVRSAAQACADLQLRALCTVIAAGTGRKPSEAKTFEPAVYSEGLVNVVGPVTEYLVALMDPSGRGPAEGDDQGKA